jgi:hypothetical protein
MKEIRNNNAVMENRYLLKSLTLAENNRKISSAIKNSL